MTSEKIVSRKKSLTGRITIGLLSIFLPVQETKWFLRSARHMTSRNLERMRDAFPELNTDDKLPASPLRNPAVLPNSWIRGMLASAGAGDFCSGL